MSKRTLTKIMRTYDPVELPFKDRKGLPMYRYEKRDEPMPPLPMKEQKVKCGGKTITVRVSHGQIINEKKVCKRYYQSQK